MSLLEKGENMKKFISIFISLALIMAAIPLGAFTAYAEDSTPTFSLSEVSGAPGDSVTVDIVVENNPGITSAQVNIGYDATVLEPTAVAAVDFSSKYLSYTRPLTKVNPFKVTWSYGASPSNVTTNGVLARITFKILDTAAAGKSDITLTYDPNNVFDFDWNNVTFAIKNGSVTVLGEEVLTEPPFTYKIVEDEVVIVGCDSSASGSVTVPDTIAGLPVTTISDSTFNACADITSVLIPTSVTTLGADIFTDCASLQEVLYTGSQTKWNKITVDSANDELTAAKKVYLGDVRFSSATLTLYDDFAVSYKINKASIDGVGYTDVRAVFEINGVQTTVSNYTEKDGKYVFKLNNIAPNQLNDTIYATLYATYNGVEYVTSKNEYSVATYCYNLLQKYSDDTNSELRTLLVDLLNYGAKAQTYTEYNTEKLCNAALTDTQKAWATQENPTLQTVKDLEYAVVDNPTVTWEGAALRLRESVTINFVINAQSIENLTLKVSDGTNEWNISAENFIDQGDNIYHVYFNGFIASQMRNPVYVTVYNGETAVSNTICYSIESYAYEMADGTDENLTNLLIDMMKYGDAAYAYAN